MSAQPHIIRRQVLNVRTTGGNADGVRLQRDTEQLYRSLVLPGLERLLDKYSVGDEVIAIDKLSVSLKGIRPDAVDHTLAQQILDEMERQLRDIVQERDTGKDSNRFSAEERFLQCWVYYLQHGYFPWWARIKDNGAWIACLERFIQDAPLQLLQSLKQYFVHEQVRSRLAIQPGGELFWQFFKRVSGWSGTVLSALQADEQTMTGALYGLLPEQQFRQQFRASLLSACMIAGAEQKPVYYFAKKLRQYLGALKPEALHAIHALQLQTEGLNEVMAGNAGPDEAPGRTEPDATTVLPGDEAIYINNAGIVLVAPYLSAFFPRVGLVTENTVTDAQRAVGIVQYMVSGSDDYAEFEMVLPKILCGIAPETAVADGYRLTAEEKEQVDELLRAVISHWDALKTTSPDGLRDTFLRREGKLVLKNDTWVLQVQEQAFDILLDYLPWSFSMIRLPWMQQLLQVNWR